MKPLLTTPRLVLALPGPEDDVAIAAFQVENDGHLARWSPPRPEGFFTAPYWRRQAARCAEDAAEGTAVRLVIHHASGVAGMANLTRIFRGPACVCTLGYSLGQRFEGQGIMYEALSAVVPYVFDHLRLHRIEANHMPENTRSARLLGRLGFVREGYARRYLYIDDAWRDHVLTSLTHPGEVVPRF